MYNYNEPATSPATKPVGSLVCLNKGNGMKKDPSIKATENLIWNYGRKIHLDFHTPKEVPSVGHKFNADEFADTLKSANVNSIVMFTAGHFGFSYFPTKIGIRHPKMKVKDIFGPVLDACHKRKIKVVAYHGTTEVQEIGFRHPEWCQVDNNGDPYYMSSKKTPRFNFLCLNSPYTDEWLIPEVEEILEAYDIDGFFFDWVRWQRYQCYCKTCLKKMKKAGIDPKNIEAHRKFNKTQVVEFQDKILRTVRSVKPDLPVYFNSLSAIGEPEIVKRQSFLEVESLAAAWGLLHMPMGLKHNSSVGKPVNGMTSRFVKSWGDFGGLTSADQMKSECACMLMTGTSCSIGDHLDPSGKLDPEVYHRIGEVYEYIKPREKYSYPSKSRSEIAVLASPGSTGFYGAVQILLERNVPFDIIDEDVPDKKYKLCI